MSEIEYTLVRTSGRKTVEITVGLDGVLVTSPKWVPLSEINRFVNSNVNWIQKLQARMQSALESVGGSELYVSKVPYLGKVCNLEIKSTEGRDRIIFEDGKFTAHVKNSGRAEIERLYYSWLKRKSSSIILDSVSKYQEIIGVEPTKISFRNQKTRWGSATRRGSVSFNVNMLKAPVEIIDYIVVHELCHLKIPNHSKKFWNLVESVVPDYKAHVRWLKKNGAALMNLKNLKAI